MYDLVFVSVWVYVYCNIWSILPAVLLYVICPRTIGLPTAKVFWAKLKSNDNILILSANSKIKWLPLVAVVSNFAACSPFSKPSLPPVPSLSEYCNEEVTPLIWYLI